MDDSDSDPLRASSGASWAHVSGWAQLSGARRTVSCVLPCGRDARALVRLLPLLSDTLTECGYPWEVLVVSHDPLAGMQRWLHDWMELPGFRLVEPPGGLTDDTGFATGLMRARGDAVILCDARTPHPPALIQPMIERWEGDAWLVYAGRERDGQRPVLRHWDGDTTLERVRDPSFALPQECTELGLLDRRLVDWMTGDAPA